METQTTTRACNTCPALGRDGNDGRPAPNLYDYQWTCETCRAQIPGLLNRIPFDHADLDATPANVKHEGGKHKQAEAPLGVSLAVLSELSPLTWAQRHPELTLAAFAGDQDGPPSTARILYQIAHEWHRARRDQHPHETLPTYTITDLAKWLHDRTEWACNALKETLPDHAHAINNLAHRLRWLNDPGSDKPEPVPVPITCNECDRYALAYHQGDIICTACGNRMTRDQYDQWVGLNAEHAKHDHEKAA